MSATPDSTFTGPEQRITDLERQLAECRAERDACKAERDEALEQQTATAEVLGVINSSPGDLAPVFDAMLAKIMRLCEAAHGHFLVYDGTHFHPGAFRGEETFGAIWREGFPFTPSHNGNPLARLISGERLVLDADAREGDAYREAPHYRRLIDAGGIRSSLTVALRKEDKLLGAVRLYRREVRPFSDKQIVLVENFAAQAVIAMENARLLTETREALEQQTATAEVLQVINSSPGDLAPVFDAILEKAHTLCGADHGALQIYDGEFFRPAAIRGLPEPFAEQLRQGFRASGNPVGQALLAGERFVHIRDLVATHPELRAATELAGTRTLLSVPLRKDGRLLGVIVAFRQEVRPFSDNQIALLQNFAAQAVIAMGNARLITETREALEQQTATAEVLGVINSSPGELAPVFDAMLEKATRLCEAPFGTLRTWDGERFHFGAVYGDPQLSDWVRRRGSFHPDGGQSPLRRIMEGEQVVQVADASSDADYSTSAGFREMVEASGMRSVITVALRKDETLLGSIHVYRQEVRPFSDKQVALLQNFAAQAVIAMENARLITETREALEQQTATADVLQVINSSPGDLAPVFEAMLDKAMRLCDAAFGSMNTYDGELLHRVAERGLASAYNEWREANSLSSSFNIIPPAFDRLIAGETVVHTADLKIEERYKTGNPSTCALVDLAGARTLLAVALRRGHTVCGMFTIFRQEVRPFTDKQIALLQNFAAQAVIAMENARLLTETREALEQQTATAEVLGVINSSPGDLAPVFDTILEKAHHLCGAAHGIMMIRDGERFRTVAVNGLERTFVDAVRQLDSKRPPEGSGPARLIQGEQIIHFPDFQAESYLQNAPPQLHRIIEIGNVRTTLMVPLRKDDAVIGIITAFRREVRPFSDKQIALLQNFAAQAVIAIENARLITETREALEQQTATAEVLGVINSSPGELTPVFDAILEKAHALCGAATGSLQLYDGEFIRAVATRGVPDEFANILRQPRRSAFRDASLRSAPFVQITDIADPVLTGDDKTFAAAHDITGVRTHLRVPLRKDDALLGFIVAGRREVRPFTDKQIALLQNFAAQAVIAIENARLLGELRQRTDEVAELNRGLEARIAEQVDELGRVGRLKRFLAPQLAELIVSQGDEKILESHRREIVVVFCDLRGYTAFTETAEPEEVLDFLREYHGALGPLVSQFEGTLDQFSGDGIMVFFNDPVPIPDPAERAVRMAIAMREAASALISGWRRLGRDLGFGAGIAQGYATLGQIGFSERSGYTAIGTVCNVAARLCAEAKDGQILISQRVAVRLGDNIAFEDIGSLVLKGLMQPVSAFNVPLAAGQPALRVIEGGPQSG